MTRNYADLVEYFQAIAEVAGPEEAFEQAMFDLPDMPIEMLKAIVEDAVKRKRKQDLKQKISEGQFTAADLFDMDLPPLRFEVAKILPTGLTIFAGKPKIGKSWLVLILAISVATGGMALGSLPTNGGTVLYMALEDGARRLQERLKLVLQRVSPPKNLHFFIDWPRLDSFGFSRLEEWIGDHPDTCIVIIDTFIRVRPTPRGRSYSLYQEDYEALSGLQRLANSKGVAILTVLHLRKAPADDPLDQVSGTSGLTGAADTVWILNRNRGRADGILTVTGRDIEEQELALTFDKSTTIWRIAGQAVDYIRSPERQEIVDVLRQSVQPLGPKEVAKSLKKKSQAVKKLMCDMVKAGDLARPERGKYTLPSYFSDNSNLAHHGYLGDIVKSCVSNSQTGDEATR